MDVHLTDFLTIGLLVVLEALLSADNALVLAILVLGLPRSEQRKALRYGILGAFAFRIMATLLAVHLLQVAWVKLIGALYLLYLTWTHFFAAGDSHERRAVKAARPWMGLSAFWATVLKVELTDIVFAVDSILVAVAMSPKTWVIISGGILGIVAMRMVIGKLLVRRYPALVDGVPDHRLGGRQADRCSRRRLDPLPGEQVDFVRSDRRDLRGRLSVRTAPGPGVGCRGR
jgi:YkoY family integral membrane protein